MSVIAVNSQYLANLATNLREIATLLRGTNMTRGFETALCRSPEVWEAFKDFDDQWDERRRHIANSLEELASGFDMTRENFEQADAELAQSLTAGNSD